MEKVTVKILPSGETLEIDQDKNLLTALREAGIYVKSTCGGVASCSDCIVKIVDGEDNLNTPTFEETKLIGNVFHITKERLSCQLKAEGDFIVDLSGHDKDADAEKLKAKANRNAPQKTSSAGDKPSQKNIRTRKKADVEAMYLERDEQRKEKEKDRNSWQNHWQKGQDSTKAKKMGGSKRPKPFRTDHLDKPQEEEEES